MSCKWTSSTTPRTVVGRHDTDCPGEECRGCLPCTEPHCSRCGIEHTEGACPKCIGEVRDDLTEVGRLVSNLPNESEHRGVESGAMMLLGPSADPESWGRRAMKLLMGGRCLHHQRGLECPDDQPIPAGPACGKCKHSSCTLIRSERYLCPEKVAWIDDSRDERHPLFVLGTWEMAWRDHLGHLTDDRVTVLAAVGYLDRQLTYMGGQEEPPFDDFARDVSGLRTYLEDVLHDGEREERGAPCPACGNAALTLDRGEAVDGSEDRWVCPRKDCGQWWTEHDYRVKVEGTYVQVADKLTASQIRQAYRVPEGTVRQWAVRGHVTKHGKDQQGRQLYDVAQVVAMRDADDESRQSA